MSASRIKQEYKKILNNLDNTDYFVEMDPATPHSWHMTLVGPADTPFKDGIFSIKLEFPEEYPLKPFKMVFQTQIFHPQISASDNTLHLDFFQSGGIDWNPEMTVEKVMVAVVALLKEPDLGNTCFPVVRQLCGNDRRAYNQIAKEWTRNYAS